MLNDWRGNLSPYEKAKEYLANLRWVFDTNGNQKKSQPWTEIRVGQNNYPAQLGEGKLKNARIDKWVKGKKVINKSTEPRVNSKKQITKKFSLRLRNGKGNCQKPKFRALTQRVRRR